MLDFISPGIMWIGLAVIFGLSVLVIDRIFRRLVNKFTRAQAGYPHRVANELPRVLHRGNVDEVIEAAGESR